LMRLAMPISLGLVVYSHLLAEIHNCSAILVYDRTIVPCEVGRLGHDHEGALHGCVADSAELKALNCEIACRIGIEPDFVGASWNGVCFDVVTNYPEIVKNVRACNVKTNVLSDRDPKNVTSIIWFGSVRVGELPVELM